MSEWLDRDSGPVQEDAGDEILDAILRICREALPGKKFSTHDDLLEIGASSLALVEIYTALDEMFPGRLEVTDLVEHPSIASLAKLLQGRRSVV